MSTGNADPTEGEGDGGGRGRVGNDGKKADPGGYYRHVSVFWNDLVHLMSAKPQSLMSVGPMRNFAANAKKITAELAEAGEDWVEFNKALAGYYRQLAETWNGAQKKVAVKAPGIPQGVEQMEAYKRVWIDIFDNDFTELFDSKRFGEGYGRLVARELDLTRHWNNIMDVMLQSANLPSRKEIDEVYRELHSLKKRISRMEAQHKRAIGGEKRSDERD